MVLARFCGHIARKAEAMHSTDMVKNARGHKRKRRPRRYSAQFKENAIKLAVGSDKSLALVAKELGIPSQCLYRWVSEHELEHGAAAPEGESVEAKVKRLEKRVAQLEEEREILKKAATFFAKESE